MTTNTNYARAARLTNAKSMGPGHLEAVERDIATEVIGATALDRDDIVRKTAFKDHKAMSAFQATEEFGNRFADAVTAFTAANGIKTPKRAKYLPAFATDVMFSAIWRGRQVADELGMPYGFFIDTAMQYWSGQGNTRLPRITQLTDPCIVVHVMARWATERNSRNS